MTAGEPQAVIAVADAHLGQQRAHTLDEVAAVARCLKPDQIILEQRAQQGVAPRQLEIDVQRREGNVEEKGKRCVHAQPPQISGDKDQLIVMNPDEVARLNLPGDRARVFFVDAGITVPIGGIEVAERLQVVEQRPQHLVGKSVVEARLILGAQRDRREPVTGLMRCSAQGVFHALVVVRDAGPADPDPAPIAEHGQECRDQTAAARAAAERAVFGAVQHHGQAVGDDDQTSA